MKTLIKFMPVILMGGLIAFGIDVLIAAPVALVFAIILCMIMEKIKMDQVMSIAVEGAKAGVLPGFVLMLAYALAAIFMSSGVGASAIGLFLHMGVNGRTVALVAFLAACVISVSTGTSWGTVACCVPIFMWLCDIVGGSPALTFAAIIGGAGFGDNIGLISDTTILSSSMQGVNTVDRVRFQFFWSLGCVAISAILFYAAGLVMGLHGGTGDAAQILKNITPETMAVLEDKRPAVITLLNQVEQGVSPIMLLPIILVIIMAISRIDTLICLISGIGLASIMGLATHSITSVGEIFDIIQGGFADAGSWSVVMLLWVMAFGAVMREMDAFQPLASLFLRFSKNVRTLLSWNGLLCLAGNLALAEDLSEIATISPVIKGIVEDNVEASEEDMYKLKMRNALFADSLGVHGAALIPWHSSIIYYLGLVSAVYPMYQFAAKDLYMNFMSIISLLSLFLLTLSGLDRFIPGMKLPKEPQVRLKKDSVS